jgi:hypothetical protein
VRGSPRQLAYASECRVVSHEWTTRRSVSLRLKPLSCRSTRCSVKGVLEWIYSLGVCSSASAACETLLVIRFAADVLVLCPRSQILMDHSLSDGLTGRLPDEQRTSRHALLDHSGSPSGCSSKLKEGDVAISAGRGSHGH